MTQNLLFVSWSAVSSKAQARQESLVVQQKENFDFVANLATRYPSFSGTIVGELQIVGSRWIIELEEACRRYPAYAKLVSLIRGRWIDAVVYRSYDRIGRTEALIMTVVRLCERHRVYIIARQNPPVTLDPELVWDAEGSGLVEAIEAFMAASEIRRLTNYHQMGMITRVERGNFSGRLPWGYIEKFDEEGNKSIVIDQEAAQTIRMLLLDLYVGRQLSLRGIAKHLNDTETKSPRVANWASSTIEKIIKNADRYAGYVYVNRNSPSGRPHTVARSSHPQIISDDELQAVREEVERRSQLRQR